MLNPEAKLTPGATVAVVIVNYKTPELAIRCLKLVERERQALPQLRAVIVDNHSDDGSVEKLKTVLSDSRFSTWASLLALKLNGGFGWANNQAILQILAGPAPPEFIHLLNPDAFILPGAIETLSALLVEEPSIAAAGSQLLEPDGSSTGSAFSFPTLRGEFARAARIGIVDRIMRIKPDLVPASRPTSVDWVTGASVMFRVATLRQSGLFDDGFFLYHEEIELMSRLRKLGWEIFHEPRSRVVHVGGASTGVHSRPVESQKYPRRPAYWYETRRRFFARTRGTLGVVLALTMWTAGYTLFRIRMIVGLGKGLKLTEHEFRDRWTYGWPRAMDCTGAVVFPGDDEGHSPRWIEISR